MVQRHTWGGHGKGCDGSSWYQNHNSPSVPGSVPYPHRWVFLYEKGYQTSSGLISSVSVKLKGLAVTQLPGLGPQVWDVADYVFPAQVS